MKRTDLLKQSLTKDKNVELTVETAVSTDKRFLKREKRNIQDSIEDLEAELTKRLSAKEPLDKSTIEVTFQNIQGKKELLALYESFEETYFAK